MRPGEGAATTAAAERPARVGVPGRDVEAPEVFKRDEAGLWDGRPSLGGVWVAHPDVRDPERVLIRNAANGQYVIGALFRRERENPGPRFQVSSDAAAALGLLAGAPTELQVVALRRAETTPERDPAPEPETDAEAPAETPAETPAEDTEIAAAPAAEAGPARRGPFGLFRSRQTADEGLADAPEVTAAPLAEPAPAEPGPSAPQSAATEAQATSLDAPARTTPAEAPRRGLAALFAPRRPPEPLSALAIDPAAPPAKTVTPAAAPAGAASPLARPFLQIGIFGMEDNARATASDLRRAGLTPVVHEETSSGKTFWRVVVGPATTESDRGAALAQVREMGFGDAFAVSR